MIEGYTQSLIYKINITNFIYYITHVKLYSITLSISSTLNGLS